MTEPPTDTDRIIAAQRDEARKTRTAIVVTLLVIFVGLPIIGLIAWGVIASSHDGQASTPDVSTTAMPCPSAVPTETDPGATLDLDACPLSGTELTDDSSCAAFNTAESKSTPSDRTNPTVAYMTQAGVTNEVAFEEECATHPGMTLSAVVQHVRALRPGG